MKTGDIYTLKEDGSFIVITGFENQSFSSNEYVILNFKGEVDTVTIGKLDIRVGNIKDLLKWDATTLYDNRTEKRNGIMFPVAEYNMN